MLLYKFKHTQADIVSALNSYLNYFELLDIKNKLEIYQTVIDFYEKQYKKNFNVHGLTLKNLVINETEIYQEYADEEIEMFEEDPKYYQYGNPEYAHFHKFSIELAIKLIKIIGNDADTIKDNYDNLSETNSITGFCAYMDLFCHFALKIIEGYIKYKISKLHPKMCIKAQKYIEKLKNER